jgi:hypothetical protein
LQENSSGVNTPSTGATNSSKRKEHAKKTVRQQYQELLRQLCIKNDKHYDNEIVVNKRLRVLENLMAPRLYISCKEKCFQPKHACNA